MLSEYQLSEAGCKVDSKPIFHTFPNGGKGTQSLILPKRDEIFKHNIDSCLVTYPHRLPTPEEVASLHPIDITSLADWDLDEYTVHSERKMRLLTLEGSHLRSTIPSVIRC